MAAYAPHNVANKSRQSPLKADPSPGRVVFQLEVQMEGCVEKPPGAMPRQQARQSWDARRGCEAGQGSEGSEEPRERKGPPSWDGCYLISLASGGASEVPAGCQAGL